MKKELKTIKHARSAIDNPEVDLNKDEYVVLKIERSKFGVIAIWAMVAFCIIVLSIALIAISNANIFENSIFAISGQMKSAFWLLVVLVYIVIVLGGFLGQMIYTSNKMYITNHRAIQKVRRSLFANSTNVIELKKIEDVSFHQASLLDHVFHIGVLRMSTVGDETTYTFTWLDTPRDEVQTISELVSQNRNEKDK